MRNQVLLLAVICTLVIGNVDAQESSRPMEGANPPFPDVVMCTKRVEPIVIEGKSISQRAIYESVNPDRSGQSLCGWIKLQFSVGARKAAEARLKTPWFQWIKVRGYQAWRQYPMCSTPPCGERMEMFLTDDHVMTLSGDCGYNAVLNSAQSAKLSLISAYIDKLKETRGPVD